MKTLQQWVFGVLSVILAVALIVTIVVSVSKENPTNSESLMLSVLISVFSILAAILVSHLYYSLSAESASDDAKKSFDEKIRTFARKAAEKVFNLSNEFDRLADSLKTSIDDGEEGESNKTTLLVLREKMLAAIHILETLKSMNDTSLSDWQGIIGEDIQLQRQLQREISEQLEEQRQLIARLESRVGEEGGEAIEERVQEIEQRLLEKIAALPFTFRPVRVKPKKQEMQIVCPGCKVSNTERVRTRAGATKLFQCNGCKHFVGARYSSETEYQAEMAPEKHIEIACGVCKNLLVFNIPDHLGAIPFNT